MGEYQTNALGIIGGRSCAQGQNVSATDNLSKMNGIQYCFIFHSSTARLARLEIIPPLQSRLSFRRPANPQPPPHSPEPFGPYLRLFPRISLSISQQQPTKPTSPSHPTLPFQHRCLRTEPEPRSKQDIQHLSQHEYARIHVTLVERPILRSRVRSTLFGRDRGERMEGRA